MCVEHQKKLEQKYISPYRNHLNRCEVWQELGVVGLWGTVGHISEERVLVWHRPNISLLLLVCDNPMEPSTISQIILQLIPSGVGLITFVWYNQNKTKKGSTQERPCDL